MALNDIIALNVGGTRFETTRQTLLLYPDSMLAKMFDIEMPMEPGIRSGDDGAYFFDRDPDYFRCLLNFLRCRKVILDGTDPEGVLGEAEYFGVEALEERVKAMMAPAEEKKTAGKTVKLEVGDSVFKVSLKTISRSPVLQAMYDGDELTPEGNLFVDEDPEHFVHVLNAMRYAETEIYIVAGVRPQRILDTANRYLVHGKRWIFPNGVTNYIRVARG